MQLPTLLSRIHSPQDLQALDMAQLVQLCDEIRVFLIENVSRTGGHLSSNLGVVELTVALHAVFNSPDDMLVFDVGHQCYTHKLLTGRAEAFPTLRQQGGMSGFPDPEESEHDIFKAGHGSTALSVAVGLARAKKMQNLPGYVIAVVGDGASTGGLFYEGLNNIDTLDNLIVVLNDNHMSISKNVGSLSRYFTRLRTSPSYYKAKSDVKSVLDKIPVVGTGLKSGISNLKTALRHNLYHSTFFEDMGFRYVGPVDGHDLPALCGLFDTVRQSNRPMFLHIDTVKGKGFTPAERNPGAFHGVGNFDAAHISDPDMTPGESFSTVMGQKLVELAQSDSKICAITAAMKYGTGLQYFKKQLEPRFFDVGMAEAHAVTFAAGLARGGMRPAVCIYSTFMQRAYDSLIHDVMLQNLDVLFVIDRAGLVPGDGDTHQGIYDAAYFSQQCDMPLYSPANYAELRYWLEQLEMMHTPRAIRYARGGQPSALAEKPCSGAAFDRLTKGNKADAAIVSYGVLTAEAMAAAEQMKQSGKPVDLYQMVCLNPIPDKLVQQLQEYKTLLFCEEGVVQGGIGEHLLAHLHAAGFTGQYVHRGVPPTGVDHATVEQLRASLGLDAEGLVRTLLEAGV